MSLFSSEEKTHYFIDLEYVREGYPDLDSYIENQVGTNLEILAQDHDGLEIVEFSLDMSSTPYISTLYQGKPYTLTLNTWQAQESGTRPPIAIAGALAGLLESATGVAYAV